jgi:hypothetical protein
MQVEYKEPYFDGTTNGEFWSGKPSWIPIPSHLNELTGTPPEKSPEAHLRFRRK